MTSWRRSWKREEKELGNPEIGESSDTASTTELLSY